MLDILVSKEDSKMSLTPINGTIGTSSLENSNLEIGPKVDQRTPEFVSTENRIFWQTTRSAPSEKDQIVQYLKSNPKMELSYVGNHDWMVVKVFENLFSLDLDNPEDIEKTKLLLELGMDFSAPQSEASLSSTVKVPALSLPFVDFLSFSAHTMSDLLDAEDQPRFSRIDIRKEGQVYYLEIKTDDGSFLKGEVDLANDLAKLEWTSYDQRTQTFTSSYLPYCAQDQRFCDLLSQWSDGEQVVQTVALIPSGKTNDPERANFFWGDAIDLEKLKLKRNGTLVLTGANGFKQTAQIPTQPDAGRKLTAPPRLIKIGDRQLLVLEYSKNSKNKVLLALPCIKNGQIVWQEFLFDIKNDGSWNLSNLGFATQSEFKDRTRSPYGRPEKLPYYDPDLQTMINSILVPSLLKQ